MFANPMTMALAMYRYWIDVLFSPFIKAETTAAATIDAAKSIPQKLNDGANQMKRAGRRPPYISARIHSAHQNAG
jgi:hypothetical protein